MAEAQELDGEPTKRCPACAEQIKADAMICRYCGYNFATQSPPGAASRTNGFAIASMVLGIVWIYWIGSILAVIFGHIAIKQIASSGDRQTGKGMAIAGLVLGYIGLATLALFIIMLIVAANSGY